MPAIEWLRGYQGAVSGLAVIGQYVRGVEGIYFVQHFQPGCRRSAVAEDVGDDFVLHYVAGNQCPSGSTKVSSSPLV